MTHSPTHATVIALGLVCLLAHSPARAADGIAVIGRYDPAALAVPQVSGPEIWRDPTQPIAARVHDLLRRMSLAEKTSQLRADAVAIPRLGIPAYSYRNESLHGIRGNNNLPAERRDLNGVATVFPEPIGMAATWDVPLIYKVGDAISTEARAKFNDNERRHPNDNTWRLGLNFYAPNLNLCRDPRWGRGQETYGEDPFMIGQFGVAYIRGMQGNDPRYLKTVAGAKHFAVHSGPEPTRTYMSMSPSQRDLYDTYLPGFEAAVRQAHVGSVMGAYSALYGIPDCENPFLLTEILRRRWGFTGFVVSDGGAIKFNWEHHKYEPTPEQAAANAIKAGCDLFSGAIAQQPESDYDALGRMLQKHLVSEAEIDRAVGLTLAARFRLGLFDPPSMVPWSKLGIDQNDTPAHRALALKVAEESIVLLKNDGTLPLVRSHLRRIAVIGPNAAARAMLLGNYHGVPSRTTTILEAIKHVAGPNIDIDYAQGCPLALRVDGSNRPPATMTAHAVALARSADAVIFVSGINSTLEEEGGPGPVHYQGFWGDRKAIELPPPQEDLLRQIYATGKPIVLVNCSGSAMAMPWEAKHLPAIVQAWYPGEDGGTAVARVLFGDVNPAGRLPVTFYRATADLPPLDDYAMRDRTYRYFTGTPLWAFGHGLSYTHFEYAAPQLASGELARGGVIHLSFTVKNVGPRAGDEVAQVYFRHVHSAVAQPRLSLCGFTRVHLAQGEAKTVALDIPIERFRYWDDTRHDYTVEPGAYDLLVGAGSDDIRLRERVTVTAIP